MHVPTPFLYLPTFGYSVKGSVRVFNITSSTFVRITLHRWFLTLFSLD